MNPMKTRETEARKRPGPVPGPPTRKYNILLEEELGEWGKLQPGGLSELIRRLLSTAPSNRGTVLSNGSISARIAGISPPWRISGVACARTKNLSGGFAYRRRTRATVALFAFHFVTSRVRHPFSSRLVCRKWHAHPPCRQSRRPHRETYAAVGTALS